ncbi:MAG: hypothetical protein PHH54_07410 [Candidatus Nanoarchaeia archaeon]|nr:hypothetical protein [Candidatus Nanoarchaeia archaeon]MDD5741783.1 hypothetical protein [Candidatus Nanoarchaeia archaeon]
MEKSIDSKINIVPTTPELISADQKRVYLGMWMVKNSDAIFKEAPGYDYALAILKTKDGVEKPVIHYFKTKHTKEIFRKTTGLINFLSEQLEKTKGILVYDYIYRHQADAPSLLLAS